MPPLRPQPRANILDIDAYTPGRSAAPGAGRTFKLSSNESPLGPSPRAIEAYAEAARTLALYPDGGSQALKDAVAARYRLDPAGLMFGNGSDELLALIAQTFLSPGDEGVHSQFGFLSYPIAIRAAGAVPVVAPERDLIADVEALLARVTDRTRVVFLANPNNPTGAMLGREALARLHAGLPLQTLLVLDAAYAEYVSDADYEPGRELVEAHENVVMTRTFSKAYGLAGVRLGWMYARPYVIDAVNRIRGPFNVNAAAQAAGVAALADGAHLEKAVAHNAKWLPWLRERLHGLGLTSAPSAGNFLLVRFRDAREAAEADAALTAAGFMLRAMGAYGLPDYLRLSVGDAEANVGVVAALKRFLAA